MQFFINFAKICLNTFVTSYVLHKCRSKSNYIHSVPYNMIIYGNIKNKMHSYFTSKSFIFILK